MCYEVYKSPLRKDLASEIESLLVAVFKYGNYSFKKALAGWDESGLQTLIVLCRQQNKLKGVVLSLYDAVDPRIALFGPIAVAESFRGGGIGRELAGLVLDSLEEIGVQATYIGVKEGHPARRLYERFGFQNYSGVVMRKLFVPSDEFESKYFEVNGKINVRKVSWADYPKFQAIFSYPFKMKTFDWRNGCFSSKYMPVSKFLGVFPEMIEGQERGDLNIKCLTSGYSEILVGLAKSYRTKTTETEAVNVDFIVHDDFLENSDVLIQSMIQESLIDGYPIYSECLASDHVKKMILNNNSFFLDSEADYDIVGYGAETVQKYKYIGEK